MWHHFLWPLLHHLQPNNYLCTWTTSYFMYEYTSYIFQIFLSMLLHRWRWQFNRFDAGFLTFLAVFEPSSPFSRPFLLEVSWFDERHHPVSYESYSISRFLVEFYQKIEKFLVPRRDSNRGPPVPKANALTTMPRRSTLPNSNDIYLCSFLILVTA